MLAATMPPAPGTFSTTKGLPNAVVNLSARRRAITSGLPPGPDTATSRTGCVGQGSSWALAGLVSVIARAAIRIAKRCMVVLSLSVWPAPSDVAPDLLGEVHHQPQLLLLHLRRNRVAGVDAGEATLRADRETIEIAVARGVLDTLLQLVLVLHRRGLGGDKTQNDG